MDHRVNNASGTDNEYSDCNSKPYPLVEKDVIDSFDALEEESNDADTHEVVDHNGGEVELDLDVGSQDVVNKLDLLVCIVDLVACYEPLVFSFEDRHD